MFAEIKFDLSLIGSESWLVAGISFVVVYVSLIFLWIAFEMITKIINANLREKLAKIKKSNNQAVLVDDTTIPADVTAAISTALYLYFNEMHDEEKTIMTIQKVSRNYSPWSSKIYNVMNFKLK